MMKRFFALFLFVSCICCHAHEPWRLNLKDTTENIVLRMDLHAESVEVPGMEMFGLMNGYLGGDIYGVWVITSFRIKRDKAILRLSNDLGSETQEAELTQNADSTYQLKFCGTTVVKRAQGRRLYKITPKLHMVRMAN